MVFFISLGVSGLLEFKDTKKHDSSKTNVMPFSGVEPIYQKEIQTLIRSNPQNKGILLTDHNYRNILEVSDKLYLLRAGALKQVIDFAELEFFGYVPSGTFERKQS